jgi:sec-independent protein translocase protein TatA
VPNVGPTELIILVVVVLLVFGSRRLPEIGRSLGKGMREFKHSVSGKDEEAEAEAEARQPAEVTAQAVEEDEEPVGAATGERERSE